MPAFLRYIGIDYSGAQTPRDSVSGLRVYLAQGDAAPVEVPPPSARMYWTRRGISGCLIEMLGEDGAALVGINHAFSFLLRYFAAHDFERDWSAFLDDFQRQRPTDENTYVDFVRDGLDVTGPARGGNPVWKRLTERRVRGARSVFHFSAVGSVAQSAHAGIPWLRHIRRVLRNRVHVSPFDGFVILAGRSGIAEVDSCICRIFSRRTGGHP